MTGKFKVIVIAGPPGTGKTTLVRETFEPEKMPSQFKFAKLCGHTDGQIFVGGVYDGSLFAGTDKLSMAVQPDVLSFLRRAPARGALIMEGDRVSNAKFLKSLEGFNLEVHLVMLSAPEDALKVRYQERGSTQAERWLASRRTKAQNLQEAAQAMPHVILHVWGNETRTHLAVHVSQLRALTRAAV